MTRRVRNLISLAFMAAFLAVAPLVLLWTAGYKYDWKKRQPEKTGIIQTDSVPVSASVFLNGVDQRLKTPATIPRLLPEDYEVRLERSGYFPWKKSVEVTSGTTTFVTGAALIKDVRPEIRLSGKFETARFSRDGKKVAYIAAAPEGRELFLADSDGADPILVARLAGGEEAASELAWSPSGQNFLHLAKNGDDSLTAVIYAAGGAAPQSIQGLIGKSMIRAVAWTSDGSRVMVKTAGGFSAVDPEDGSVTLVAAGSAVQDADMRGRDTFSLRTGKDGVDLTRGIFGGTEAPRILRTLPPGKYAIIKEDGPYLLVADSGKGRLLAISYEDGSVADELTGGSARWYPKGREPRLLVWNAHEITAADIRTKDHRLITRQGDIIGSCEWHPSGLAVFYSSGNALRAADLDAHEPRNIFDLASFDSLDDFAVDESSGLLLLSGSSGDGHGLFDREY